MIPDTEWWSSSVDATRHTDGGFEVHAENICFRNKRVRCRKRWKQSALKNKRQAQSRGKWLGAMWIGAPGDMSLHPLCAYQAHLTRIKGSRALLDGMSGLNTTLDT